MCFSFIRDMSVKMYIKNVEGINTLLGISTVEKSFFFRRNPTSSWQDHKERNKTTAL
jgi:hypothetical protein